MKRFAERHFVSVAIIGMALVMASVTVGQAYARMQRQILDDRQKITEAKQKLTALQVKLKKEKTEQVH